MTINNNYYGKDNFYEIYKKPSFLKGNLTKYLTRNKPDNEETDKFKALDYYFCLCYIKTEEKALFFLTKNHLLQKMIGVFKYFNIDFETADLSLEAHKFSEKENTLLYKLINF